MEEIDNLVLARCSKSKGFAEVIMRKYQIVTFLFRAYIELKSVSPFSDLGPG